MVERTASEVIPAIEKSIAQIEEMMKQVNDDIAAKTKEINEFQAHYKIQTREQQPIVSSN